MTIIIFLIDTSASMNQRTYLGTTILDTAKAAVETFMKIRARDPNSRWDRYMLLTFEDPPANVKAGWKESHATFSNELKNLEATGLTSLGPSMKNTFDLLNVNRMQSGIDTYGQGRCPFYLEPAVIIAITDGRKITTNSGICNELNLPMNNLTPGCELTKEPFRWDQRLFGLVLRLPATPPTELQTTYIPNADDSPVDAMCDVTGGRSYAITSQRMLLQCLDSLVQKCQKSGVVINFEKVGPDPPPLDDKEDELKRTATPTYQSLQWQNCRKVIYVPRSAQKGFAVGHWPIPESFWPDLSSGSLPPRDAQPIVKFSCTPCEPSSLENLPFDKYELEPSPLTQYIMERRQPNVAWQVFVGNSAKYSDIGHAFGYLKASSREPIVNLFVMPYNYPALLPLLEDLFKVHKLKPNQQWRQRFDNYLKTMPLYYAAPLRKAMQRMGAHNFVPEQMDNCLSYSVVSYLKKLKNQAKTEYEKLVNSVGQKLPKNEGIKVTARSETSILERKDFNQLLEYYGSNMSLMKQELTDYNTFTIAMHDKALKTQSYKNPFDIPRKNLLDQLTRMRTNLFKVAQTASSKLQDEDKLHHQPVQQMGNYQEYLKRMPQPLRELEVTPVRQHTFGNPFKVNKNLMIDEADEAMPGEKVAKKRGASSPQGDITPPASPRPNKRKPGPLPKNVPTKLLMSPRHEPEIPDIDLTPLTPPPLNNHSELTNHNGLDDLEEGNLVIEPLMDVEDDDDMEESELVIAENGPSIPEDSPPPLTPTVTPRTGGHPPNNVKNSIHITEHNAKLKSLVIKEVKKPGKNYTALFDHLNTIQGSLDSRCILIRDVIHEALRFKKRILVQKLELFEQSMIKVETRRKTNSNKAPSR